MEVHNMVPIKALFTEMQKVSDRFDTVKLATSLWEIVLLSNVPNLIFKVLRGASIFKTTSSVIAEQLAPVSNSAYVGHLFPPADTSTGTVGRTVKRRPAHAARSQDSLAAAG